MRLNRWIDFEGPSSRYFAFWRALFGIYMAYYAIALLPYARELYTTDGVLATNPLAEAIGLRAHQTALAVSILVAEAILSALLIVGVRRRLVSCALFVTCTLHWHLNLVAFGPERTFIAWMTVACCLVPEGESLRGEPTGWRVPASAMNLYWFAVALTYLPGGISKIGSPDVAWRNGEALKSMLADSCVTTSAGQWVARSAPWALLAAGAWTLVLCELFAPIIVVNKKARAAWTFVLIGVHGFGAAFFDLQQVSFGMLLVHAFVAEPIVRAALAARAQIEKAEPAAATEAVAS